MPMMSQSSSNMLSLKVMLICTGILSAAIMLKVSAPAVKEFAVSEVPSIYNGVVSWLRPPYLYIVINCIIITIVASSKLQPRKDDVSLSATPPHPLDAMAHIAPQPLTPMTVKSNRTEFPAADYKYNGAVSNDFGGDEAKPEKELEFGACEPVDAAATEKNQTTPFIVNAVAAVPADAMSNKENDCAIAKSYWNAPEDNLSAYSLSNVKPPVSARFAHRKNVKASPEGGKTVLGVSKSRKQDTLESTWKTITEGRPIPLTRHLRKSDTWERPGQPPQQENTPPPKKMTKAGTFNDRTNTRSPSPGSSGGGSGKLRREPSPSQDELNRRVEAFIRKFNEDMRLQRQESLNQYREMISRGAH